MDIVFARNLIGFGGRGRKVLHLQGNLREQNIIRKLQRNGQDLHQKIWYFCDRVCEHIYTFFYLKYCLQKELPGKFT